MRMYPHKPIGKISDTEKKVFYRLKDECPTDWVGLHSYNIADHVTKNRSELDFLIIAPPHGFFFIEVKGAVKYEKNKWVYRYGGKDITKDESPFEQASKNMDSIIKWFKENVGLNNSFTKFNYSWGVIFPSYPFKALYPKSPEWTPDQVFDAYDRSSLSEFIVGISNREYRNRKKHPPKKLEVRWVETFKNVLRPSLPSSIQYDNRIKAEIDTLTDWQTKVMVQHLSKTRVYIPGSASTGKTVLAIEKVQRELNNGKSVCVIVPSETRLKEKYIRSLKINDESKLYVGGYEQLLLSYIDTKNIRSYVPPDDREENRDNLYVYADDDIRAGFKTQKFDAIIGDEVQMWLSDNCFLFFNQILRDSENDSICLFGDPVHQSFKDVHLKAKELKELCEKHQFDIREMPPQNCRNTRGIAEHITKLAQVSLPKEFINNIEGEKVEYSFYQDEADHNRILNQMITEYFEKYHDLSSLRVIAPDYRTFTKGLLEIPDRKYHILYSSVNRGQRYPNITETCYDENARPIKKTSADPKSTIYIDTMETFHGSEADTVILTQVPIINSIEQKAYLYRGMSRSVVRLKMLIDLKNFSMVKARGLMSE